MREMTTKELKHPVQVHTASGESGIEHNSL